MFEPMSFTDWMNIRVIKFNESETKKKDDLTEKPDLVFWYTYDENNERACAFIEKFNKLVDEMYPEDTIRKRESPISESFSHKKSTYCLKIGI